MHTHIPLSLSLCKGPQWCWDPAVDVEYQDSSRAESRDFQEDLDTVEGKKSHLNRDVTTGPILTQIDPNWDKYGTF